MTAKTALLVLEDGSVYTGSAFGAEMDAVFELVFNTSMTGYQEIITDPSYRGQGVLFTVPHIGNVGINLEDMESSKPQVSAVIVRSLSPIASNWRSTYDLNAWLKEHNVPGISDLDTRAITRKLRERGALKAALTTRGTEPSTLNQMLQAWQGLDGRDMVAEVTCAEPYHWNGDAADHWLSPSRLSENKHVVLIDFGAKRNILRHLAAHGCRVTVVPAYHTAEKIFALAPDGVMLSNGPGDPAGLPYAQTTTQKLIASGIPIFGICLGHQLIARALGGKTGRLKFGHHGGNHPVQDLRDGKVFITAQNHNYMVYPDSLNSGEVEITHRSLNDDSVEGLRMKHSPVYSVQFHPEAAPGPHDAHEIFTPFINAMREARHA